MKLALSAGSSGRYAKPLPADFPDDGGSVLPVYVDDMWRTPLGQLGRMKMSHMIADTEEELHAMAAKLGLRREWYQGDHYDVSKRVRGLAIHHGAREIPMRQLAAMAMLRRFGEPMGDPETAVERMQAWWKERERLRQEKQHADMGRPQTYGQSRLGQAQAARADIKDRSPDRDGDGKQRRLGALSEMPAHRHR